MYKFPHPQNTSVRSFSQIKIKDRNKLCFKKLKMKLPLSLLLDRKRSRQVKKQRREPENMDKCVLSALRTKGWLTSAEFHLVMYTLDSSRCFVTHSPGFSVFKL